jgi:hypothetical protein
MPVHGVLDAREVMGEIEAVGVEPVFQPKMVLPVCRLNVHHLAKLVALRYSHRLRPLYDGEVEVVFFLNGRFHNLVPSPRQADRTAFVRQAATAFSLFQRSRLMPRMV